MATKLKNKFLKTVLSIVAFFMLGGAALSAYDYIAFHEYLTPYFESSSFRSHLFSTFKNVSAYYGDFNKYTSKSDKEKVSDNEIQSIKDQNRRDMENEINNINNKYDDEINQIAENNSSNNDNKAAENSSKEKVDNLKEEKNKYLEEIKKKYSKSDEEIRKDIIADKDKQYTELREKIANETEILFYIVNDKTGEKYNNANFNVDSDVENYIKVSAAYSLKFPFPQNVNGDRGNYEWISSWMTRSGWHGYFIVLKDLKDSSSIKSEINLYESKYELLKKEISTGSILFFIGALLLIISLALGKDSKSEEANKGVYSSIPIDIRCVIFGTVIFVIGALFISVNRDIAAYQPFYYKLISEKNIYSFLFATFVVYFTVANASGALRLLKNKDEFIDQCKKSVIGRIFSFIHKSVFKRFFELMLKGSSGRTLVLRVMVILILTMLFGFSLQFVSGYYWFPINYYRWGSRTMTTIYVVLYLIFIPTYILRKMSYFNKILLGAEEMANGNLDYEIKEEGHHELSKLAHNINNIESGFKKAVEQQVKSERLKSELITNVSHDLKTPLTSIINYIDLLRNDELSKEEIAGYIGVLDRKSQRLKVLIEDLFEASKAASGTVELNIEKLDVVQLLKQTLGEFDEKIKKSSLMLKFNDPKKNIFLNLDGKKTWRIFENLLINITKYSQSNTRVYIDVIEEADSVKIVMKNISAYEMDFDVDEIFERFKRGDKSRHTEGSGLGLAIARSITELQGGTLNIELDGDLFKATVEFKK